MIKISKQNNSLIVEGIENAFYINNGDNSYPLNSLIVVTDKSDMATFRSVATNDVLFSGLIQNIIINGEAVTKDNIIEKFDTVSNSSTGGGTVDAYTKEEADNKFATKTELTNVQTVANDADTKVDALTPRVEGVETAMGNKQDTLVSGTNIKTINSQSILGEGNIEVGGGIKIYEASEMPTNFKDALYQVVYEAYYTMDKVVTIDKSTDVEEFLSNLKTGDYLQVTEKILIQYYGIIGHVYKFAIKTGKEQEDIHQYGRLITVRIISNMFYIANNESGPVLQKNDLKTINGEEIVGSGNIEISGGISEEQAQEIAKIPTLETELAQKANVSDVPTVQTDRIGTNKNYIYSDPSSSYTRAISKIYLYPSADKIEMQVYDWLPNDSTVSSVKLNLSTATATKAGVMTAADKTKLDSIPENIPSQSEIDGIAANVSALQTAMDGKQPTLVSGTNIKTINGNSILGEGNLVIEGGGIDLSNYYNKTEVDTKLDTKQNTLVSGTNIKTINSQSILGEGNIEVTIPDATTANSGAMSAADKTKLDSISTEWTGTQSEYDALATKDNNTIYYVTE